MRIHKGLLAVAGAAWLVGCAGAAQPPQPPQPIDIGKVLAVKSTFGPDFQVNTAGPAGIDPKLLVPQRLPEGITFDPPECGKYAGGQTLPTGLKGNMAAVSAEGEGNRFIAIAVETSERVPYDSTIADKCKHVTMSGATVHGVVDIVDSPHIDGAQTLGTHRQLQTAVGSGELYNYVAYLDDYLVVVTANPLVTPNQPVGPVDTQRARDLLTAAVSAVR